MKQTLHVETKNWNHLIDRKDKNLPWYLEIYFVVVLRWACVVGESPGNQDIDMTCFDQVNVAIRIGTKI